MLNDGLGPSWKLWRRQRYIIALLASLGFFNAFSTRASLSLAIVAMTTMKTIILVNGTATEEREFDWDSQTNGLLLSSFFYGYIVTQFPSALLAARFGGSKVFGAAIFVSALLSLVTPPMARLSIYLLFAVRLCSGLFQGVMFPCIYAVWAKWAPPLERSRLAIIAFSGTQMGTVATMSVSGVVADYLGWPFIFYIFVKIPQELLVNVTGTVGVLWYIAWLVIVKERPEKDPYITPQELKYIQDSLDYVPATKFSFPPWKNLFTSLPVWAIVVAHLCSAWGFFTQLTQLPTFLSESLNFHIQKVGFMSALPYVVNASLMPVGGFTADYLRTKGLLNATQVRKLFSCGCFVIQSIFLLIIPLWHQSTFIIICFMVTQGAGAIALSGFNVNHLDVAPQYASILMGLSNTFASMQGIISPAVAGYIVHNKNPNEWQYVFYIASTIYIIGALFYGIFGSGKMQNWACQHDNVPTAKETTAPSVKEEPANDASGNIKL